MSRYLLTIPNYEGSVSFMYDDDNRLTGILFEGHFPDNVKAVMLKTLPLTPDRLEVTKGRTGVLVEIEESVTFEMFWNRYNDKARSSRVKTERVWNRMTECERRKAYRFISRYKSSIPQGVCMKYATTYLNDQLWNN